MLPLAAARGTNASVNAADVHLDHAITARLHALSGGAAWGVSPEVLADALGRSVAHRFDSTPSQADLETYLSSLHIADLALACACRAGNDAAWEHLVREVRPALYASARTIAGDDGRELADSLYAELYGLPGADGQPRSLLGYFHGRSRLITWLRSVMVQRLIDRRRQSSRLSPLDESEQTDDRLGHVAQAASDPHRDTYVGHTQRALDEAIDTLAPKDRIRLRLYYGQDLTLARIGRLLGESEATVSRRLAQARRGLRADVERRLRTQHGMSDAAVQLCFEYAASAPELQLDRLLTRAEDG
jgi:RNA polymerase sigma-70 factor, ECF subfamily